MNADTEHKIQTVLSIGFILSCKIESSILTKYHSGLLVQHYKIIDRGGAEVNIGTLRSTSHLIIQVRKKTDFHWLRALTWPDNTILGIIHKISIEALA